jgi:predicted nucleic acid-binding protein
MIVVSDTSPINYLILINCVDVLPAIFGQVFTAPAVLQELTHERSPEAIRKWASIPPQWLIVKDPSNTGIPSLLGPGETAAIALAEELHADWLLIDERDGRDEARHCGRHARQPILGLAKTRGATGRPTWPRRLLVSACLCFL